MDSKEEFVIFFFFRFAARASALFDVAIFFFFFLVERETPTKIPYKLSRADSNSRSEFQN